MPADPNRQRVAIRYRADDGFDYSVVTSRNHAVAIGATGAQPTDAPLPTKWKPRLVHGAQILGGHDRGIALVEPNPTSGLWRGTTNDVDVQPYGPFEVTGRSGERRTIGAPGYDGTATPAKERVSIAYLADNNQTYSVITTREHAAAVAATSGAGFPSYPDVWTTRHYNAASTDLAGRDQKLRLIEPRADAANWVSDAAIIFNVNGGSYRVTGRKDENRPRSAPSFVP